jgi:hypothetical protein
MQNQNDLIRDKLWADVYLFHVTQKEIWFRCREYANQAVMSYDKRLENKPKE